MSPTFTILLPVNRPPALLPYAIESVRAQERDDFELLIVCDGASEATVECARVAAKRDSRIKVFSHPKGQRHGEHYRHLALQEAKGTLACGIADDDLWFPNHLTEMAKLLQEVEFGHLQGVNVELDTGLTLTIGDVSRREIRKLMQDKSFNYFGPTVTGYRMSTYRRLAVGWSPAPEDLYTDLHMWRKFFALPGITCGMRLAITSLHFRAPPRREWPLEKRVEEIRLWAERIQSPLERDRIAQHVLCDLMWRETQRCHRITPGKPV